MANPHSDITSEICSLVEQIHTACKTENGAFRKQANLILIECTTLAASVLTEDDTSDPNTTSGGTLSPEQIKS